MTINQFLNKLKKSEQTISTFLGIFVVIVIGIMVFSRLQSKFNNQTTNDFDISTQKEESSLNKDLPTIHKVKSGEKLWDIAILYYNSGYNWVDIAKANKLSNPDLIFADQELTIPNVTPTTIINSDKEISSSNYTISKGDDLWTIAVRSYGDGYKWVEIAKANDLVNPGIIHPGNVLVLPR